MTGLYGKMPGHGDFVRRRLPESFLTPWDAWLQAGIAAARSVFQGEFDRVWASAPLWRFRLPAGACGDGVAAGILIPSWDFVGRHFPLTLAAVLPADTNPPPSAWYAALELAGTAAIERGDTADALMAALPEIPKEYVASDAEAISPEGWWTADEFYWDLPRLPTDTQFSTLLRGSA